MHVTLSGWTEDLREDWTRLAEASRNVFATWEWAETWLRHHGHGREVTIAIFSRAGDVVGILPLIHGSRHLRLVTRLVGHGPADEAGPICAAADREEVAAAVPEALRRAGRRIVLLERLPAWTDWAGALGGRVVAGEASPVLALPAGTWDDLLAGWSANRRGQARRLERQLARTHAHTYALTTDEAALDADLDALFSLHRARWEEVTPFVAEQAFHRDFARTALRQGWLRLRRMEIDGRPVAAWYGLRFGDVESYYQAGRDPAFESDGVGRALLLHSIRAALESGATEYRFLRGNEAFKTRFATDDQGIVSVAVGRDPVSRGLIAMGDRMRRSPIRRTVRRRLDGVRRAARR